MRKPLEALVCNFAYAVLKPSDTGAITVPLSKRVIRSRYDNPAVTPETMRHLIDTLAAQDFFTVTKGTLKSVTTVKPSDWFKGRLADRGVTLADFCRHKSEELVILSKTSKSLQSNAAGTWGFSKRSEWIDYESTTKTNAIWSRVKRVNTTLAEGDIGFIEDGALPIIDPYVRTLRRYFSHLPGQSVEFQSGGRLFGGFWMNLSKWRRKGIRINGEPPALLDFSNMFANLLYAEIGELPPNGDLYDLTGYLDGYDESGPPGRRQGCVQCPVFRSGTKATV